MASIRKKFNTTFRPKDRRMASANSTFAVCGVQCSADTFLVNYNFVLRIKFCAINPAYRKSANSYKQPKKTGTLNMNRQKNDIRTSSTF
jgi:uncharacterized protein YybS (DUF2232 family)